MLIVSKEVRVLGDRSERNWANSSSAVDSGLAKVSRVKRKLWQY